MVWIPFHICFKVDFRLRGPFVIEVDCLGTDRRACFST